MSRIGKNPIPVPNGVTVNVSGQELSAKGKLGELKIVLVDEVLAEMNGDEIKVQPRDDSTRARTMWGMSRTLVSNVVLGVSEGFSKNIS